MKHKVWCLPVAWVLGTPQSQPQLTEEQYQILRGLITNELWHVANYIRAADNLSAPVPEGHWRWADFKGSGYERKSAAELVTSMERNRRKAVELRERQRNLKAVLSELEATNRTQKEGL